MQLQNLCSLRLNVEGDLLEELGRLPEKLADTYAQIFEHIRRLGPQSRGIAESSLKWLLCQARELSEAEFLAAVSMGPNRESINLTKETILFICGNLVMFDQELKVFRFAHLSVREYLETQSEFTLGAAHALGAEMSLLVCLHRYTELAAKYARKFRRYAILYWLYHCQEAKKSSLGGSLHQLLEDFLQIREGTNLCYAVWARSVHRLRRAGDDESENRRIGAVASKNDNWRVESDHEWSDSTDDDLINGTLKEGRPSSGARGSGSRLAGRDQEENTILDSILGDRDYLYDPTFAACCLGLPEIVEQNLRSVFPGSPMNMEEASVEREVFDARNVGKQTYLHVACHSGSSKLLRLLLQWRLFSVRSKDKWGRTALHYAVNPHDVFLLKRSKRTGAIRVAHDQAMAAERVAMIGLLIENGSIIDAFDRNKETALHRASSADFVTEAQALLEHGAFVNPRNYRGSTPLILPAELGHTAVVRLLLEFKADTEAKNQRGMTPLLLATKSGHTAIAQLLLQLKVDIEARDQYEMTPLLLAAMLGHVALTQLLLQSKADIEARDIDQRTPLLQATKSGHTALAQLLLQSKANIEARDKEEMTPLLLAAMLGHVALTQLLLQSKADIEARDIDQRTPLLQATKSGHTAIAQLLLQSKADIEARDQYGRTPLYQTVLSGRSDTFQLFLQLGADINAKDSHGEAPLARSLSGRNEPMTLMLIEGGASISELDRHGNTALHYAALSRLGAVISRLLEMGAYIDATNMYGSTPLHVAIKPQSLSPSIGPHDDKTIHLVQLLIDAGADIEMSDWSDRTPLHLAAQMADEASIQVLLDRGANVKAEASEGLLPLDHAAESHSLEVFSLLFKRWADVMAESSKDAVESWLRLAPKTVDSRGLGALSDWRTMRIEDLIELTTPGSKLQKIWAERGARGFSSWYRAKLIVKEMRARREAQPVI